MGTKKDEERKESVYGDESLSCLWIPSLTPNAQKQSIKKPDKLMYCPGCNHPLKRKQLIRCKLTLSVLDDAKSKKNEALFECGGCAKQLTNATKSACLRKCGHVVCSTCIQQLVAVNKCCVVCDEPVRKKKDVIFLSSGGTGFAAHGNRIEAIKKCEVFQ